MLTGTFTISNLGMFGVKEFGAILPPGTGSILAIAAAHPKVVQLPNGHFGVQKTMTVTITCDHRHIYGADAAEFLKDLAGERDDAFASSFLCCVISEYELDRARKFILACLLLLCMVRDSSLRFTICVSD